MQLTKLALNMAASDVVDHTDDHSIAAESAVPATMHQEPLTAAPAPERATQQQANEPHTVLIVEDATELAEVIAATLERIQIRTLHETHVERALAVYQREHPDVILLDIGLPDKTGWKLLDAIKEADEEERPTVIVITAHNDPANRLMGKLQGVHSYLLKPFTPNEVEQIVGTALLDNARSVATSPLPDKRAKTPLPEFLRKMLEEEIGPPPDESTDVES